MSSRKRERNYRPIEKGLGRKFVTTQVEMVRIYHKNPHSFDLSSYLEMATTQVVPECESMCVTAVCVVSFNTNLSNLTNRAG